MGAGAAHRLHITGPGPVAYQLRLPASGHKIPLKFQPSSHQSRPDSDPIQTVHRVWHYAGSGMPL